MKSPFDSPLSGFRSPFAYGRRLGTAFNALMLFQNGEQGVVFAPDPDTCFTDTAGTTTAGVGDAVALMLDKSQGAGYSGGVFTGLGPELVTNGTFDTDTTGFTATNSILSSVSGNLRIEFDGGAPRASQSFSTKSGSTYILSLDKISSSNAGFLIRVGTSIGNGDFYDSGQLTEIGNLRINFRTSAATTYITVFAFGADENGEYSEYDNISVRELPGNHATQPTAAARPILARVPEGGRRNLLTRTEELDDEVWQKLNATISLPDAIGPDGKVSAATFGDDNSGGSGVVRLRYPVEVEASSEYTVSFFAKAGSLSWVLLSLNSFSTAGGNTYFDILSGSIGDTASGVFTTIEDIGDGWFRCSITFTSDTSDTNGNLQIYLAKGNDDPSIDLDGTSYVLIYGAQLELGSTATPYQRVGSTYDVTEAGKADKWHLVFDGVDDVLLFDTSFSASGFTAILGASVSDGTVAEISALNRGNSTWYIKQLSSSLQLNFRNDGFSTTSALAGNDLNILPDTLFVSMSRKDNANLVHRVNGSQVAESTSATWPDNTPLSKGSLGTNTQNGNFAEGKIFALIAIDLSLTDAEIDKTEAYVAGKTGIEL